MPRTHTHNTYTLLDFCHLNASFSTFDIKGSSKQVESDVIGILLVGHASILRIKTSRMKMLAIHEWEFVFRRFNDCTI